MVVGAAGAAGAAKLASLAQAHALCRTFVSRLVVQGIRAAADGDGLVRCGENDGRTIAATLSICADGDGGARGAMGRAAADGGPANGAIEALARELHVVSAIVGRYGVRMERVDGRR